MLPVLRLCFVVAQALAGHHAGMVVFQTCHLNELENFDFVEPWQSQSQAKLARRAFSDTSGSSL